MGGFLRPGIGEFMSYRRLVTAELASLFNALSHPDRVRIVEELRNRELNVNELEEILEISHSRVSQHLGVLKNHRLVATRREGRRVYYRLENPELAGWLLQGLDFVAAEIEHSSRLQSAMKQARKVWGS